MKKILFVFCIIFVFIYGIFAYNSNLSLIIHRLDIKDNASVKSLKYKIYFLGIIPLGEAVFRREEGVRDYAGMKIYHLEAKAKGYGYSAVLDSYVNVADNNPVFFKQALFTPSHKNDYKEVFYNQKDGIMRIGDLERKITFGTQDQLSAIFNLLDLNLIDLHTLEMNINTNQKNYLLEGRITSRDILTKRQIRKIVFIKSQIRRKDKNNPYHRSQIDITLLRAKQNIPVFIKVFSGGVLITAKLIGINS